MLVLSDGHLDVLKTNHVDADDLHKRMCTYIPYKSRQKVELIVLTAIKMCSDVVGKPVKYE